MTDKLHPRMREWIRDESTGRLQLLRAKIAARFVGTPQLDQAVRDELMRRKLAAIERKKRR